MSMGLSVERQQEALENCSTKIERWNAPQAARPLQGASGARGGNRASVGAPFFFAVRGARCDTSVGVKIVTAGQPGKWGGELRMYAWGPVVPQERGGR